MIPIILIAFIWAKEIYASVIVKILTSYNSLKYTLKRKKKKESHVLASSLLYCKKKSYFFAKTHWFWWVPSQRVLFSSPREQSSFDFNSEALQRFSLRWSGIAILLICLVELIYFKNSSFEQKIKGKTYWQDEMILLSLIRLFSVFW